jgi:predicted nucleic acid-binding protein
MKYFYDSYAIIAGIEGRTPYERFIEYEKGITSYYNILEVCYYLLRTKQEHLISDIMTRLLSILVEPSPQDILPAMRLRQMHASLSYTDALGYTLARRHQVQFLTGDEHFRDLPHVEFIK